MYVDDDKKRVRGERARKREREREGERGERERREREREGGKTCVCVWRTAELQPTRKRESCRARRSFGPISSRRRRDEGAVRVEDTLADVWTKGLGALYAFSIVQDVDIGSTWVFRLLRTDMSAYVRAYVRTHARTRECAAAYL